MASPTIAAEALDGSAAGADETEHELDLPADVAAGDLLVAVVVVDQSPTVTWPVGWTPLQALANGAIVRVEVRVREADGSEGATVTLTTDSAQQLRSWIFRVAAAEWEGTLADGIYGASASGTSTDPDSPNLAPGAGALDFLWIAGWGNDNGNRTFSGTYPASYTDGAFDPVADAFGVGFGRARRALNASSENPGAASSLSASDEWVAFTLAVAPATGSSPQTIDVAGVASEEAFGAVSAAALVDVAGVASEEAFGTLELALAFDVAGVASEEAFGAVTIEGAGSGRRVRMLLGVGP